jgi:hypothetical protein
VAAVAVVVVNLSSGRLLGIEAEFGIGFAALHVATGECGKHKAGDQRHAHTEQAERSDSPVTHRVYPRRAIFFVSSSSSLIRPSQPENRICAALSTAMTFSRTYNDSAKLWQSP